MIGIFANALDIPQKHGGDKALNPKTEGRNPQKGSIFSIFEILSDFAPSGFGWVHLDTVLTIGVKRFLTPETSSMRRVNLWNQI
jgi:hypothetical protein